MKSESGFSLAMACQPLNQTYLVSREWEYLDKSLTSFRKVKKIIHCSDDYLRGVCTGLCPTLPPDCLNKKIFINNFLWIQPHNKIFQFTQIQLCLCKQKCWLCGRYLNSLCLVWWWVWSWDSLVATAAFWAPCICWYFGCLWQILNQN